MSRDWFCIIFISLLIFLMLFLSFQFRFADLNLRSPVLSYIKVSRCSALHRVSITSTTLQVISILCKILLWHLLSYLDTPEHGVLS